MSGVEPKTVKEFEANLLRLARCAFRPAPAALSRIAWNARPEPPCLSRNAIALLKDTLGKGCLLFLIRAGGWRGERGLLRPDISGPIWERTPADDIGLRFTGALPELLIAAAALPPVEFADRYASIPIDRFTIGDRVVLTLFYQAARGDAELARILRPVPAFQQNALLRLAFPEDFEDGGAALDWQPWLNGPGGMVLDALQPWLAQRWEAVERTKGVRANWAELEAAGRYHAELLGGFLQAARTRGRIDLVRFLPRMLGKLFGEAGLPLAFWTAGLAAENAPPRLAERIAVFRSAVAVPRLLEITAEWIGEFRAVPFYDDRYPAAQWGLAEWERYNGERTVGLARRVLREAEPL